MLKKQSSSKITCKKGFNVLEKATRASWVLLRKGDDTKSNHNELETEWEETI